MSPAEQSCPSDGSEQIWLGELKEGALNPGCPLRMMPYQEKQLSVATQKKLQEPVEMRERESDLNIYLQTATALLNVC